MAETQTTAAPAQVMANAPLKGELIVQPPVQRSVLNDMAARYGMEPTPFEQTVRAIAMPEKHTREEFAAFLLIAKEYRLNPLTREIYAFPKKGGGIVPIVSIDGWVSLINQNPHCDGFEFAWEQTDKGEPISCTCIMHRKDRAHPVTVTEYFSECVRPTDPWKMKHRMLRHKALIQAGRYAFGFAGIYDADEGEIIAEAPPRYIERQQPPNPPDEPEPSKGGAALHNSDQPEGGKNEAQNIPENITASGNAGKINAADMASAADYNEDESGVTIDASAKPIAFVPTGAIGPKEQEYLDDLTEALEGATTEAEIEEAFDHGDPQTELAGNDTAIAKAFEIKDKAITALATKQHADLEAAGQTSFFGDAGGPPNPPEG